MAIATVRIFSGVAGIQRNARYAPLTASIQGISKYVPTPNRMYDQPFVIIQAMPKHSNSLGFKRNCATVFKIGFAFFYRSANFPTDCSSLLFRCPCDQ